MFAALRLLKKNRLLSVLVAGEPDLSAKRGVVRNPFLDMTDKIIKVRNGHKSVPNYLRPLKADGVD